MKYRTWRSLGKEVVRQAMIAWNQCKHSKYLFHCISQSLAEAKTKFDAIISSMEELEMAVEKTVWETEYKDKQAGWSSCTPGLLRR